MHMGRIDIAQLEPGMVLEEDCLAQSGFVLLSAGAVVTEKHIGIFRSWDVTEVAVEGVSKEGLQERETAKVDPAQREKLTKELQELFRHTDMADPVTEEIFRQCLLRKAGVVAAAT